MKPVDDVGFLIKIIHSAVSSGANNDLRKHDLTISQLRVLRYLGEKDGEPSSQKELEDFFHVTHPTMIGILKRLESKELICVTVNEKDRRHRNAELTEKARCSLELMKKNREEMEARLTRGLSDGETDALKSLLRRIYENVSDGAEPPCLTEKKKEGKI